MLCSQIESLYVHFWSFDLKVNVWPWGQSWGQPKSFGPSPDFLAPTVAEPSNLRYKEAMIQMDTILMRLFLQGIRVDVDWLGRATSNRFWLGRVVINRGSSFFLTGFVWVRRAGSSFLVALPFGSSFSEGQTNLT